MLVVVQILLELPDLLSLQFLFLLGQRDFSFLAPQAFLHGLELLVAELLREPQFFEAGAVE